MATKTVKRPSKNSQGEKGLGQLTKLSDSTARMDFDGGGSYPLSFVFVGEEKNIPDHFKFKPMPINKSVGVSVTLTSNNDGILFITPANSDKKAKFSFFIGGDEGKIPAPTQKTGTFKGKPYKFASGMMLETTEGIWAGCKNYHYLVYEDAFGQASDGTTVLYDGTNEKYTDNNYRKWKSFLDAAGVDLGEVKFSENVLPEIQRLALQAGKEFRQFVEGGWSNKIVSLESDGDWETSDEVGFSFDAQKENIHPALEE